MDPISESRLKDVHPLLADKIRSMASILLAQGIPIRVTQGFRTWDEQDKLYQQGRTTPGNIVTNAAAGSSYHNLGLAVDIVPMTGEHGQPDWDISHPTWRRIIDVGKSVGLDPGGLWRSFPDFPHFQLVGMLPVSPSPRVRTLYQTGGIEAVWEATGLGPPPSDETREA